jgi:hypothetical protein
MEGIVRKAAIGAAAVVGMKYLDAKLDLHHDMVLLKATIIARIRYIGFSGDMTLTSRAKRMLAKDQCNFYYILEAAATAAPNRTFLVYQGREWTYKEFTHQVHRYGNYFLSIGVKPRGTFKRTLICTLI